ncbi:unnamed protein product [Arabidopsis halleri]
MHHFSIHINHSGLFFFKGLLLHKEFCLDQKNGLF